MFAVIKMWYKNIAGRFFGLVTKHTSDRHNYDSQDRASIAASRGNNNHPAMHILNQVQVNLIYNTNRNLFLSIKILISTTDLYNTTANGWSCHLPNRNLCATQVLPMGVNPFTFRYQANGTIPCQYYMIPLERQLIALQLCR